MKHLMGINVLRNGSKRANTKEYKAYYVQNELQTCRMRNKIQVSKQEQNPFTFCTCLLQRYHRINAKQFLTYITLYKICDSLKNI
jgi:hypothetical protein